MNTEYSIWLIQIKKSFKNFTNAQNHQACKFNYKSTVESNNFLLKHISNYHSHCLKKKKVTYSLSCKKSLSHYGKSIPSPNFSRGPKTPSRLYSRSLCHSLNPVYSPRLCVFARWIVYPAPPRWTLNHPSEPSSNITCLKPTLTPSNKVPLHYHVSITCTIKTELEESFIAQCKVHSNIMEL